MKKIKRILLANAVPILFLFLGIGGVYLSGTNIPTILSDLVNRFDRNIILVLSLIIPCICGMGMNFGIVLGAMCGQLGLITVTILQISGLAGILAASLVGAVSAAVCGFFAGKILNSTKGQEMITSMIVGYFANGIYQFIFLFVIGGIIKVESDLILTGGIGIKNTVDLSALQFALDDMVICGVHTRVDLFTGMIFFAVFFAVCFLVSAWKKKQWGANTLLKLSCCAAAAVIGLVCRNLTSMSIVMTKALVKIPIVSFLIVIVICWLIDRFTRTKLGQDMRATGHDRAVAAASGIDVNRVRIISVMISTVIASFGQIVFYQNLGTMDAYYGHEKVGVFCVAAILIGGASVKRATIGQAILGTVLFHLLYTVSPLASQHLFNSSTVGGYFRMTLCYAVIALALILHVYENRAKAKEMREKARQSRKNEG